MSIKQLLTGKETGGPFFLAWVLGVFCYLILWNIVEQWNGGIAVYLLEAVRVLGVPTWQALILLSTWWRRTIWVLGFVLLYLYYYIYGQQWWNPLVAIPIFLTPVLLGARRRVWLWAAFALYCAFLPVDWWDYLIYVYRLGLTKIVDFVPMNYLIGSVQFLAAAISILFGTIAAFLMPPKQQEEEHQRVGKESF